VIEFIEVGLMEKQRDSASTGSPERLDQTYYTTLKKRAAAANTLIIERSGMLTGSWSILRTGD
jgi:hypothetical protein